MGGAGRQGGRRAAQGRSAKAAREGGGGGGGGRFGRGGGETCAVPSLGEVYKAIQGLSLNHRMARPSPILRLYHGVPARRRVLYDALYTTRFGRR